VRLGHRRVRDADVRLLALLLLVVVVARRGQNVERRLGLAVPVAELPGDLVAEAVEVDLAGDGQDRVFRVIPPAVIGLGEFHRQLFEVVGLPHGVAAVGRRQVPFAELDHQLLSRLIFNAGQGLKREIAGGFEAGFGKVGPADDVGVNFQPLHDPPGQRGAAETGVVNAHRAGPLQSQFVEVFGERPAVTVAGAAEHEVGQHRRRARAVHRVGGRARRHEERHRRRLHGGHLLGQQGKPVRKRMLEIAFGQREAPVLSKGKASYPAKL
jgi:hypothetical protein